MAQPQPRIARPIIRLRTPLSPRPELVILPPGIWWDINLRELYATLYGRRCPDHVRFRLLGDVLATTTAAAAMTTGDWPAGTNLVIENEGRIQGKGGDGGQGGSVLSRTSVSRGEDGEDGGLALEVTFACTVDNTGSIVGGAGGGSGGGAAVLWLGTGAAFAMSGSGGGGGAGATPGAGGARGAIHLSSDHNRYFGSAGSAGTQTSGGNGGARNYGPSGMYGGAGGDGGDEGQSGSSGESGGESEPTTSGPGSPGSAGNAVNGDSLITWTNTGTRIGGIV